MPSKSTEATRRGPAGATTEDEKRVLEGSNWPSRKVVGLAHDRPCLLLCGCTVLLLVLAMAVIGPGLMTFTEPGNNDWVVSTSDDSQNFDAITNAEERADPVDGSAANTDTPPRRKVASFSSMTLLYAHKDDSATATIFTPQNVKDICEIENLLLDHPDYTKYCLLNTAGTACLPQTRTIGYTFYDPSQRRTDSSGNPVGVTCSLLPQANVTRVANQLIADISNPATMLSAGFFQSANARKDGFSAVTRSFVALGGPLEGYNAMGDGAGAQTREYRKMLDPVEAQLFEKLNMKGSTFYSAYRDPGIVNNIRVRFMALAFQNSQFEVIINGDLIWTLLSLAFVYCYLWFHTGSYWLANIGMMQIMLSLPVAFFIYRLIFQLSFYTQLHVLVIFVVLGVGADDVFVLVDAWKQSEALSDNEYVRLMFTYRRTAKAVFNTSFTTTVAFLATAISPVMPVSSFGIYASLCIVLNYVFVITLTPAALIVYHRMFAHCCCSSSSSSAKSLDQDDDANKTVEGGALVVKPATPTVDATLTNGHHEDGTADAAAAAEAEAEPETAETEPASAAKAALDMTGDLQPSPLVDNSDDEAEDAATAAAAAAADAADGEAATTAVTDIATNGNGVNGHAAVPAPAGSEAGDMETIDATTAADEEAAAAPVANDDGGDADADADAGADAADTNGVTVEATANGDADEEAVAEEEGDYKEGLEEVAIDTPEQGGAGAGAGAGAGPAMGLSTRSLANVGEDGEHLRRVERCFGFVYAPLLTKKIGGVKLFSLVVVTALLIWGIVSIVWSLNLETPSEQEQWFPDDHMHTGFNDYASSSFFSASDGDYVTVKIVFGVEGVDRSEFSRWEPNVNRGVAIWDKEFTMDTTEVQNAFLAACDKLRTFQCNADGCLSGTTPRLLVLDADSVTCPLENYRTWYRSTNGATAPLPTGAAFNTSIAAFRTSADGRRFGPEIGIVDGVLRYIAISFTSSLLQQQVHSTTAPVRDEMQRFVDEVAAESPNALKSGKHTSFWWVWTRTEEGLVNGMFTGLAMCFPVAFIVLALATGNVILSLYAIVSIAFVVASVLGFVQNFLGWNLGVAESIAAVIVIGFSVDYVLHLGHMYTEIFEHNRNATRDEAVKHSLMMMGITVLAGAMTTFGAGVFMLLCQLTFFGKMAILITLTIAFAFAYSLVFFVGLCALIGPVGTFGNLSHMCAYFTGGERGAGVDAGHKSVVAAEKRNSV